MKYYILKYVYYPGDTVQSILRCLINAENDSEAIYKAAEHVYNHISCEMHHLSITLYEHTSERRILFSKVF